MDRTELASDNDGPRRRFPVGVKMTPPLIQQTSSIRGGWLLGRTAPESVHETPGHGPKTTPVMVTHGERHLDGVSPPEATPTQHTDETGAVFLYIQVSLLYETDQSRTYWYSPSVFASIRSRV